MGCCAACDAGKPCSGGACAVKHAKRSTGIHQYPASGKVFNRGLAIPNAKRFSKASGGMFDDITSNLDGTTTGTNTGGGSTLTFDQQQALEKQRFDNGLTAAKTALDAIFKGVDTAVKAANADKIRDFDLAMQQSKERIQLGESTAAAEMAKAQQMLADLKSQIQQQTNQKGSSGSDSGTPPQSQSMPTWAVVGLAVAGVAAVGGIAYMIVKKGK